MTKIVYAGQNLTTDQGNSLLNIVQMFGEGCEAHFGDVNIYNQMFHQIVSALGRFYIVAHPSTGSERISYQPYVLQHVWPEQTPYDRDRELISLANVLISCPPSENGVDWMQQAWNMVRLAQVNNVNHFVILPSGTVRIKLY